MSRYGQSDGSDDWRQEQERAANERRMLAVIDRLNLELAAEKLKVVETNETLARWMDHVKELEDELIESDTENSKLIHDLDREQGVTEQLQRNIDYWVNQYNELHRQYMIKDLSQHLGRNTYEQGRADERTDIVEYLRYRAKQGADVKGWYNTFTIAWQSIKGGNHMKKVNDDESL